MVEKDTASKISGLSSYLFFSLSQSEERIAKKMSPENQEMANRMRMIIA